MSTTRRALALMGVVVVASLAASSLAPPALPFQIRAAQEAGLAAPVVACSPDKPTVWPREVIQARAWAASAALGERLQYTWAATAGAIDGQGAAARWDLSDARPGAHTATVRVRDGLGRFADCSMEVRVIALRDAGRVIRGPGGIRGGPSRETGWSFLVRDQAEGADYGLYSYLLLGSPPSQAARERYLRAIEAYLSLVPEITGLEKYVPRRELNVAYVPIEVPPGQSVSAEWVLQHYDYARARAVLSALPGTYRDGPYIVSSLRPLTPAGGARTVPDHYLYQDLSAATPPLASSWVKEFLSQAAQERFWEEKTARQMVLKIRVTIGVLAEGLPEVRKALDSLIAWVPRPA